MLEHGGGVGIDRAVNASFNVEVVINPQAVGTGHKISAVLRLYSIWLMDITTGCLSRDYTFAYKVWCKYL